jgi:prevent-host-death family protein
MREIGAFEAKNRLGTLLDWVESGEEVIITRRGKPVARLIPNVRSVDQGAAARAAAIIIARRAGVALGGLKIKALVEEGRR